MPEQIHLNLSRAEVTPAGQFEILAITAGLGNGWEFGEEALRASLNLWQGAECFIDHAYWNHSIRDLAGVCINPEWDAEHKGVKLTLKALGPAGQLLNELGRQLLAESGPAPNVGFSADVVFSAANRKVESILRVNSLDLVLDPARGGAFLRALNSIHPPQKELFPMPTEVQTQNQNNNHPAPLFSPENGGTQGGTLANLEAERQAVRQLLDESGRQAALAAEAEAARQIRVQMCAHLLEAALGASRLPAAMQERLRRQFAGQAFEAAQLQNAIDDSRALVSELTGGLSIKGPGVISGMFSSEDQLQAAVDDLLGAPRDSDKSGLQVARLSGIRELYMMLTGDVDLHGGYDPQRVQLATTADMTGLVKNAMNKVVAETWSELGRAGYDWWQRVARTEHFNSLQQITGILVGTVGALPSVAEGGPYTALEIGDSPETASFVKYGGYIPLTLELIDRDETHKLKAYPRELAAAGLRKVSALVGAIFTANSGAGPTLADGGALFNASSGSAAGGHQNLSTTALSAASWDAVCTTVYNQPMLIKNASGYYNAGPKMAINPRYLLVPRALQLSGMKILYPSLENAASIYSENQQRGQPGDVITVPEWSDSADWAAVCDPRIAPAIFVGERFGIQPEIFIAGDNLSPAVFTNDEHRLKVRHFLAVWVNDFRPLAKANVP